MDFLQLQHVQTAARLEHMTKAAEVLHGLLKEMNRRSSQSGGE
ncbi:hypothetical protein [Paenibacillus yonginensis]|nr:hypothetical protein [Paenibacillus yonginensis]